VDTSKNVRSGDHHSRVLLRRRFADRHSGASDEVKKAEEKKFKEIGEAYSILSDAKKKARYDSGQDLEDAFEGGFGSKLIIPALPSSWY